MFTKYLYETGRIANSVVHNKILYYQSIYYYSELIRSLCKDNISRITEIEKLVTVNILRY